MDWGVHLVIVFYSLDCDMESIHILIHSVSFSQSY